MSRQTPPGGPTPENTRMLPCTCYAWRLGGAEGAQRCVPHAWEHQWEHGQWDGCACLCITCRAARHGLTPWDYACEKVDEEASSRPTAPYLPPSAEDLAVLLCGCCAVFVEKRIWLIASPCRVHHGLLVGRMNGSPEGVAIVRAIMDEQKRVAAGGPWGINIEPPPSEEPSSTATAPTAGVSLVVPSPPPEPRAPWWRAALARLRALRGGARLWRRSAPRAPP